MASFMSPYVVCSVLLMLMAMARATPPGIANNPSHARCLIKKYKYCYNLEHVCPKFCPNDCTVECVSCKPMCSDGSSTPSPAPESESPPESTTPPALPPTVTPPPNPPVTPTPPESESPPKSPAPQVSPPTVTPTPPESESPPASPPMDTPPVSTPPTATPSPPTTTPSPSPPTSSPPPPWYPYPYHRGNTSRCKDSNYPQCYNIEQACPNSCTDGCEIACATCKPVCSCDMVGAVCQDPRFIGGDGITFYFHGKKDQDFCLVSDPNVHINAHFIGKRNQNLKRDFTWVQSIGILFDDHKFFIGAQRTATWNDAMDRLELAFDGEQITLGEAEGAMWQSETSPRASITRVNTNNVIVEVDGVFKIKAKVVPITEEESRVHNYGITSDDSFAHLDLNIKFFSLTDVVNGVLGQTYSGDYVSKVKMGVAMPVMGGDMEFSTSSLFATDCSVSRFRGGRNKAFPTMLELPSLSCSSGMSGKGVVCRR